MQSWTKFDGTPCHVAEKRLLLPPLPLFNVTVMLSLSRTLTYMLTYNIDLGMGEMESGLTELTKFCKLTLDCQNF